MKKKPLTSESILENIEEVLEIVPDELDQELLKQSSVYGRFAILKAVAMKRKRIAHEKVKTIRSELVLKKKKMNDSSTQQLVEAYYRTRPRYKEAKRKLNQAEYIVDMLHGILDALDQKNFSLKDLVKLYFGEYFSGPTTANDILKKYKKRRNKLVNEMVRTKLTATTKKRRTKSKRTR